MERLKKSFVEVCVEWVSVRIRMRWCLLVRKGGGWVEVFCWDFFVYMGGYWDLGGD